MGSYLATRPELRAFFNVRSERSGLAIAKSLGIERPGRRVPWKRVWEGLGLHSDQDVGHVADLMAPLMTTAEVAELLGYDAETIHRWKRERRAGMPKPLQLGRSNLTRWRRSEIRAWQDGDPLPAYRPVGGKRTPAFGSLTPQQDERGGDDTHFASGT